MFSNGTVYEMNNYIGMTKYGNIKKKTIKLKQNKGFETEYRMIFDSLKGKVKNDSIQDVFAMHRMLIKALKEETNRS